MIIRRLNPGVTPSNTIEVPRQTSFHIPQPGAYSANIRAVSKRTRQGSDSSFVRFLFGVHVPNANVDYLAKLDLATNLTEGSDLWLVVCCLVGRKRLQECSDGEFNLDSLVGVSCDIEIEHIHDSLGRYEFPLVVVTNLKEAGSLVRPVVMEEN